MKITFMGKSLCSNEEEVIIAQINDKGENDGYLYLQWEGIYRLIMNQVMKKELNDYIRQKINIMKN